MARGGPFGDTKNKEDPYATLGIPFGTSDKKEIKRGYRRQAMKYHPDVCKDEDRKVANERFIKINAAYELLSGKTGAQNGTAGPSSTSSSSSRGGGGGYTPPHRRTSSSRPRPRSRTGEPSTDWRDYMPNNYQNDYEDNDDKYDTGGDSFAAIFSDLVGGMAGAAAAGSGIGFGGGGVMSDLIDFLEGNFPEMTTDNYGKATDPTLDSLLQSNDIDAIRNELDDTTLLVQQLETKMDSVMDETNMLQQTQMDGISFAEKMEREEQLASLNARKKVVEDYLKKSRSRLLKLQSKMKDMRTSRTSRDIHDDMKQDWDQRQQQRSTTSSSSGTSDAGRGRRRSGAEGGASTTTTESSYNDVNSGARSTTTSNDASSNTVGQSSSNKQRESFGSSGRRGSSRRSRSRPSSSQSSTRNKSTTKSAASTSRAYNSGSSSSSSARQQPRPTPPPPPKTSDSTNPQSSRLTSTSSSSSSSYVPPHRRTTSTSSTWKQQRDDKKRIQELEVEDEFEKLKRELGL